MTKKAKSKRISTKHHVKIEHKRNENNRKAQNKSSKFSKKENGVPNLCPFKDQILHEAETDRQRSTNEKQKRRENMKLFRQQAKERAMAERRAKGLEGLVAEATKKQQEHDSALQFREETKSQVTDRSAKAFYKEFLKVVESADVILQVLDARDPMGTRCREVEVSVLNASKRLVLVLNKADLVPKENLEKWVKCLRSELPTIAFKSSTQTQSNRLGHSKVSIEKSTDSQLNTSKCVGASTLMSMLGNYCRNKDVKTSIRVGVVGLPNVGKSSLINSLKRNRACNVGATPGVTKQMQEVQLDSKIKLLDSPGMILATGNMSDATVALRNAIKVDTMEDPVTPVRAILQRCPKQQMMLQYHISEFSTPDEFLNLVARSIGKLKKGGIPNQDMAARLVLNDWNMGKLKYYTHPPEEETRSTHISAEIVAEYSKEFCLESLDAMEQCDWESLPKVLQSETMLINSSGIVGNAAKEEDMETDVDSDVEAGDDSIEGDGLLPKQLVVNAKSKKHKNDAGDDYKVPLFKEEGLIRLKKASKIREKKIKKDRRRRDKVAAALSHSMEAAFMSMGADHEDEIM